VSTVRILHIRMDFHSSTEINAQAKVKTGELTVGAPEVFPLIPIAGKGLLRYSGPVSSRSVQRLSVSCKEHLRPVSLSR
jgi:hypothetical protein